MLFTTAQIYYSFSQGLTSEWLTLIIMRAWKTEKTKLKKNWPEVRKIRDANKDCGYAHSFNTGFILKLVISKRNYFLKGVYIEL